MGDNTHSILDASILKTDAVLDELKQKYNKMEFIIDSKIEKILIEMGNDPNRYVLAMESIRETLLRDYKEVILKHIEILELEKRDMIKAKEYES